jgi:uncharacterized protein (DUF952 family)
VTTIYHIATSSDRAAARRSGEYRISTRDRTLEQVGFIHCSTANQVERIANGPYRDVETPLLVLSIATDRLAAEVRYEDLEGGTEKFPHVYGASPVEAVDSVSPLLRDSSGRSVSSEKAP